MYTTTTTTTTTSSTTTTTTTTTTTHDNNYYHHPSRARQPEGAGGPWRMGPGGSSRVEGGPPRGTYRL